MESSRWATAEEWRGALLKAEGHHTDSGVVEATGLLPNSHP